MTVTEFLNQIEGHVDGVAPGDGDRTDSRAKYLEFLIEVYFEVYNSRQWWFSVASVPETITVPSDDNFAALPEDFIEVAGGVFLTSTGTPLDYVTMEQLLLRRELPGAEGESPSVYSIFGKDDEDFCPLIQLPRLSASTSIRVHYKVAPPDLDETEDNNGNLAIIPARYHQTVLIPGVRALVEDSKGGSGYQRYFDQYQRGLARMIERERHSEKDTSSSLTGFFGRR
jgi:hypothetical protein